MKKVMALVLILVLMLSTVGLVACGGGDDENGEEEGQTTPTKTVKPTSEEPNEEDTTKPTAEPDEEETTQPTSKTPSGEVDEAIAKLFKNAAKCVQGEFVTSGPGTPDVEQKLWMKEKKMRMEATVEGQESISIADLEEGVIYTYTPQMGKWFRVEITADEVASMDMEAMLDCDPEIVGSETLDGKSCAIVEYHCAGVESKTWIWKDKGWPLRSETETPNGTMVTVYKNLKFDCPSDSLFELPAGAEVMDMNQFLEGMGGEDMSGGGGEMPSIDIDELMKNLPTSMP